MASSTISGPGSGFDTQGIVKALVAAEKAPKQSQINQAADDHHRPAVGRRPR